MTPKLSILNGPSLAPPSIGRTLEPSREYFPTLPLNHGEGSPECDHQTTEDYR